MARDKNEQPETISGLGTWIREVRTGQGITQRELATRSGLSRSYVNDIERGRGTHPSVATMDKLATALGASRTDLLKAAGLLEQPGGDRETADERRVLALFRDLTVSAQADVLRYLRFVHNEEHTWNQVSFADLPVEQPAIAPPGSLPLFGDIE